MAYMFLFSSEWVDSLEKGEEQFYSCLDDVPQFEYSRVRVYPVYFGKGDYHHHSELISFQGGDWRPIDNDWSESWLRIILADPVEEIEVIEFDNDEVTIYNDMAFHCHKELLQYLLVGKEMKIFSVDNGMPPLEDVPIVPAVSPKSSVSPTGFGDMIASRFAQKGIISDKKELYPQMGTVGMVLPHEDMPYSTDGTKPNAQKDQLKKGVTAAISFGEKMTSFSMSSFHRSGMSDDTNTNKEEIFRFREFLANKAKVTTAKNYTGGQVQYPGCYEVEFDMYDGFNTFELLDYLKEHGIPAPLRSIGIPNGTGKVSILTYQHQKAAEMAFDHEFHPCFESTLYTELPNPVTLDDDTPVEKVQNSEKTYETLSTRAGLTFPVGRIRRFLREGRYTENVGIGGAVYLAAVLEYLTAELLEGAGNAAIKYKRDQITPCHLQLAVKNNPELNMLISGISNQIPLIPTLNPK